MAPPSCGMLTLGGGAGPAGMEIRQEVFSPCFQLGRPQSQPLQAKLAITKPGDRYEQEADRVAGQVVRLMHSPQASAAPHAQRSPVWQPFATVGQPWPLVQLKTEAGVDEAPPALEAAITQARGQGTPLPEGVRSTMETSFGADFSGVRLHTGAWADQLNRAIQAKAFTAGQDIFFRKGAYDPTSYSGQELLAHELTHVVQQTGMGGGPAASPAPAIQRAIGFEFQLPLVKLWKHAALSAPGTSDFLPYGEKVFEHSGLFHVESDDGEVEFVTKAFAEDTAGRKELVKAVGKAAAFAYEFLGFPNYPITALQVKSAYGEGKLVGENSPYWNPRIGSKLNPAASLDESDLLAKPQATFGMQLEKLLDLAVYINKNHPEIPATDKPSVDVVKWEMSTASLWAGEFTDYYIAIDELITRQKGSASVRVKNLATLISQFIIDSRQQTKADKRYYEEALAYHQGDSAKMRYKPGENSPMLYPKAFHTLMVRNNFRSMYNLLDGAEKQQFNDLIQALSAEYADLDQDALLYQHGYYSSVLIPELYYTNEAEQHVLRGPKVGDWLAMIRGTAPSPADLPLPGTPSDRGMGALKSMDRVPGKPLAHSPVFELRSFTGPLLPDRWVHLAEAVSLMIKTAQFSK